MKNVWTVGLMLLASVTMMAHPLDHQLENAVLANSSEKWQILEILTQDEMPLKDRFKELQPHLKSGLIQQAILVEAREDQTPTLHRLVLKDNQVTDFRIRLSSETSMEQVLTKAFDQLTAGNGLRSGIFVSAHSNGIDMLYQDTALTVKYILQLAQRKNLNIEVLELDSCNMGNLVTAADIAQYKGRVHYLLGASSLLCANFIIYNPSFVAYLPDTEAALKKVLQVRLERFSKWGFTYTNNLFVMDMQQIKTPLRKWIAAYKQLQQLQPQRAEKLTAFKLPGLEDPNWYSLTELLKWQITQAKPGSEFANASNQLLQALNSALVDQWCYSKPKGKIFEGKISAQNSCLNGLAASKQQIETISAP